MSLTSPWWARRAAFALWAAVLLVLCNWSAGSASQITPTSDFAEVAAAAMKYADEYGPEHVLVVIDIDNTLLAMDHPLGSDQWFEWQRYLLENEPDSEYLVAETFEGLLEAQGVLYNLAKMHPPQKDLPILLARLQGRGIRTLVLTSRGDEFRIATERELRRNGYDFSISALPVRDVPSGTYLPYNLKDIAADGLTEKDVAAFKLTAPRPVSYANGIMMTAGQPKGAMLLTILHRSTADIKAVVYDDDNIRWVGYVFAAIAGRGREISAYHYQREDNNMKRFQYGDKEEVTQRWKKLNRALEEIFGE